MNCARIALGRAPSALRTPISRVRSITDTSMMFMTPTPPTSSAMRQMAPAAAVMATAKPWSSSPSLSLSNISKSSAWLGLSPRIVRSVR
jgi:hypothetical protein